MGPTGITTEATMDYACGNLAFWFHIYIGHGDPCRVLSVRVGPYRLTLSNWFSRSLGKWSWDWETDC
jgi:hypothetical protein